LRILSRYLVREFSKFFILVLTGLLVIYYGIEVLQNLDELLKHQSPIGAILRYYVFELPEHIHHAMPSAVFLATLFVLVIMTRGNELLALRACGISVHRFVSPLLVVALLLSGLAFLNSEFVWPEWNARGDKIYDAKIEHRDPNNLFRRNFWYRSKGAIYSIKSFDYPHKTLRHITIFRIDHRFQPVERIDAMKAQYIDGRWHFFHVIVRDFLRNGDERTRRAGEMLVDLPETPKSFSAVPPDPEHYSYFKLKHYLVRLRKEGYDTTRYTVDLQSKRSSPLINFIACLSAIPFAVRESREKKRRLGMLAAILLAYSFWVVLGYSIALGRDGTLLPFWAAWLPVLLYASVGGLLLLNVEQ
jgi:lipopolysaccharide export system permease protein